MVLQVTNSMNVAELVTWARTLDYPTNEITFRTIPSKQLPKALHFNQPGQQPCMVLMSCGPDGGAEVIIRWYGGFVEDEGVWIVARGSDPVSDARMSYFKIGEGVYAFANRDRLF